MVNLPKDSYRSTEKTTNHHRASCSAEVSPNSLKMNGAVKGKCPDKEISTVNIKCNMPAKKSPFVNGHTYSEVASNELPKVNGYSDKTPVLNGKPNEALVNNVPVIPTVKNGDGSHLNGSSVSSESHTSDSLSNEDNNSDENQKDWKKVGRNKKRNRKGRQNHHNKPKSNLAPGHVSEGVRRDNASDKNSNSGQKTSLSHESQKAPSKFGALRSSEVSYSSVLVNGQNGISQLKNGGHSISDTQNVTKCTDTNKCSKNSTLPETCTSVDELATDIAKTVVIDTPTTVSCEKSDSSTKVEMTDVSAQTEYPPSLSQTECLPSSGEEVGQESETASPLDFVDIGDGSDVSSNPAYSDSVASADSGRGDSEIYYDGTFPYCCEFPVEKVPMLIGSSGNFKKGIEKKSGVQLWVKNLEGMSFSLVCMTGTGAQIEKAKELIKARFPHVTLKQYLGNTINPALSEIFLPMLPFGTPVQGVVSCICDPSFFWVQPYGHPHFYALGTLERRMTEHFTAVPDAPGVGSNPAIGSIVAVQGMLYEDNASWTRGCIIEIKEQGMAVVRYLDHGGDHVVPISSLRPMRHSFFSMPFFASLCCLYGIVPAGDGNEWSTEACAEFTRLCSGSRPPTVIVVGKTSDLNYVIMHAFDPELNREVDIAEYLVYKGYGVRPSYPPPEFPVEIQQ